MKCHSQTYKLMSILMVAFFMHKGCYIYAQSTEKADSILTEKDSLPANVLAAVNDSAFIEADTFSTTPYPADSVAQLSAISDTTAVALDTTAIAAQTDSILRAEGKAMKTRFMPNPKRALWLSLIIPGAGQIYNRKLWKIPIVYGGFLGCIYALSWNNQMYRDYSQAYLDIMDDDPNTKSYEDMLPLNFSMEGKEEQYQEIFKNKKNYYRKYRDLSIFAMIAVYLLSVVDAYVDAELSSFDISRDLGMKIEPAVLDYGGKNRDASVGVQCNITF